MLNWCCCVESIEKQIELVEPDHIAFETSATLWSVAGDGVYLTPDFLQVVCLEFGLELPLISIP